MRVFLTGATGFIGSRIVPELIDAGHQVLGLTRSDAGARWLEQHGAEAHRGTLERPDTVASGAAATHDAAGNGRLGGVTATAAPLSCATPASAEMVAAVSRPTRTNSAMASVFAASPPSAANSSSATSVSARLTTIQGSACEGGPAGEGGNADAGSVSDRNSS